MQPIVDWTVSEASISTIQKALDKAEREAPPRKPLERWQHHFEKRTHVETLRRYQAVDDANDKADSGPESKRPRHKFRVQHLVLQSNSH